MHPVEEYQDIITLTVDGLNECEIVTLAGRRVGVKLLYNPGEDRKSISWRSDQLEISCSRENQHPERLGPQAPGWAAQENGKETLMAIRVGVNTLQFCSVSNSLSHTTLSIKWEVYFSKRLCRSSLLCRYDSACICIMWLYNKYTLLRPDCHTWGISKSGHLEERYAIKFCFKLGKNATEMYGMLQTAFRPSCMNRASVFKWHKRFKEGRESVRDDQRCGRSKEVNRPELIGQRVRVRVTMLRF